MSTQLVDIHSPEFREMLYRAVRETLEEFVRANEARAREISLLERIVRVEEGLKALIEIQQAHFQTSEKRFAALQREMDARFTAMDKRFEALMREMDARFTAMDKRFEALMREMNARFTAMDKRFEAIDKRFEAMEKRLSFIQWALGVGFTLTNVLIVLSTFLAR